MIYNPDFTFKRGDRFIRKGISHRDFLLADTMYDNRTNRVRITLINLNCGTRWNNGILVHFPDYISMDEFVKIVSSDGDVGELDKFEQI
jgi:hypothetical protein